MKPRVFIGSSVENLALAYAIQENLEYEGNITVWSQGVFKLSSTALDDLISALNNFDFAIFVFKPDDLLNIRGNSYNVVRDNVIFELGLFIGRLGKEQVFYLMPRSSPDNHLPTDLLGHSFGVYDDKREDGNLSAALGPFCNQIREELKKYVYLNISDFENESKVAKGIVVNKPRFWEYLLTVELLRFKLTPINKSYEELESDKIIQRKVTMDRDKLVEFIRNSFETLIAMAEQFEKALRELTASFGPPGIAGKPIEIKNAVERLIQISKELLSWEYELNSIVTDKNITKVKNGMKGWSQIFIKEINTIAPQLDEIIEQAKSGETVTKRITFNLEVPQSLAEITELLKDTYQ